MDITKIKVYYECERCEYKTKLFADMNRHIKRKNLCVCKKENFIMSDVEFKTKSLEKKYENYNEIMEKYIELKNKENEEKEKDSSLYWKDNEKRCDYCFNTFYQKTNLDKHVETCKIKEIVEKNKKEPSTIIINNNNNTINNNITNNITNINVNIDNKCIDRLLIPFYEKFDTTHISNETQLELLLSALYEDTLKEMLKNDLNLNFLLIETTQDNKSVVYVGDKKVERIDNNEIFYKIWLEVKNYLIELLDNYKKRKNKYDDIVMKTVENRINEKHNYLTCSNDDTVKKVKDLIWNISKENQEKTVSKFKQITENLLADNLIVENI
jgi:hypothetical protein